MTWTRRIALALVVVAVAAGCGDDGSDDESGLGDLIDVTTTEQETTSTEAAETTTTSEAAPADDVPDGWRLVEGEQLSLALPPEWVDGEQILSDPAFATYLEETFGDAAAAQAAIDQVELIAFEESTLASGFGNNVNALATPLGGATLDQLEQSAVAQLQQVSATVSGTERTSVGGFDALRIDYTIPAGGVDVVGLQYYVLGPDAAAIVTFTATPGTEDPELYRQIAETLRFLD